MSVEHLVASTKLKKLRFLLSNVDIFSNSTKSKVALVLNLMKLKKPAVKWVILQKDENKPFRNTLIKSSKIAYFS